jgi:uncharacterized protein YndB with AHSA1/START domain
VEDHHADVRWIVPEERLIYSECYYMPQVGSPEWLATVTFEESEGGTRLTHTIRHRSRQARDGHLQAGMEAGAIRSLHYLDEQRHRCSKTVCRDNSTGLGA